MPRTAPATALIPGKYNVYAPAKKSYAAFNTLKEAQAAVAAQKSGVILDPKGALHPAQQKWSGWSRYQASFPAARVDLNPGGKPGPHVTARGSSANGPIAVTHSASELGKPSKPPPFAPGPAAGAFHLWVPTDFLDAWKLPPFPHGAFQAFATEAQAQAEALRRGLACLIVTPEGVPAATQTWTKAKVFATQLLNPQLQAQRVAGQVNVWFPQETIDSLGVVDLSPFTQGAFLAFPSLQEAKAHAQARDFGVVLDTKGQFNAGDQVWDGAAAFGAQQLNSKLTAKPTANKVNVWFPADITVSLGLEDVKPFAAKGAYLAFDSVQAAQEHVKQRGSGLVMGPQGELDAGAQPWGMAHHYAAQLLNPKLAAKPIAGRVNVWFPAVVTSNLGLADPQPFATQGAYLAFDSVEEARSHVSARKAGVVLGPKGEYEPAHQAWPQAGAIIAQRLNAKLSPTRTPDTVSVWFPANTLSSLGPIDRKRFPGDGAYLSFASVADAQLHVKQRKMGVILDGQGKLDGAVQVWDGALKLAAQQLNSKLTTAPTAGTINVWFPSDTVPSLVLKDHAPYAKGGAYLAFDSLADAKDHVKARHAGAILAADGSYDASVQEWNLAGKYMARLQNPQLKPTATPDKVNVWFALSYVSDLGLADERPFVVPGAYLAFDSVADAQAHVKLRGHGVIFGPKGDFDGAAQVWSEAQATSAQQLNAQLKKAPTPNTFNVWFPSEHTDELGVGNSEPFKKKGAYLSFATLKEAQEHAKARTLGVLVDGQGKYLPTDQVWKLAARFGPPMQSWPPPPVKAEAQVASENVDSDIQGVYSQATAQGARVAIRTHNTTAGEALRYELYVSVAGTEMKLKDLGSQTLPEGVFVHDGVFEFDYQQINDVLSVLRPDLQIKKGETVFGVRVTWPNGHNQGASGGGGSGNHRFVAP